MRGGGGFRGALLLSLAIVGGAFFVGDRTTVEAREYSAYSDPQKPVLSYLLSDPLNASDFEREFGLGDEEMGKILAAVREENEDLAREYEESERIVVSKRGLSKDEAREKIETSDYDETVTEAVSRTKDVVEDTLPKDRRADLEAWVNEEWGQEVEEFQAGESGAFQTQATSNGVTFRVFATQYIGYTNYEVALPHRKLKFDGGFRVRLNCRLARCTGPQWAPVKEVGPWNTYDNYWMPARYRSMWKNLRRGVPEARAAYFNNYNGGKDEFGREVLNPAGIDLTPAVARRLGLAKYQNTYVYVYFPWVRA